MLDHGLPLLYVLFAWWFSTGLILYLDGLPRHTFRWSMLGATGLLAGALWGLMATSDDTSVTGAYLAFTCGLLVWGWHEISFLMGFLTGPRTTACPERCTGWPHFLHAAQTVFYHELAILASAALIVALTWGGPNQVGTWTFMVLWWMRLSAKLNVYLGVPNLPESFLPEHLRYLASFFAKRPMNLLFPVSVTVSTVAAIYLVQAAVAAGEGSFELAAFTFLGVLVVLALLEHWFLVLPLPVEALWRWGMGSRAAADSFPDLGELRLAIAPGLAPIRPFPTRFSDHWRRCP